LNFILSQTRQSSNVTIIKLNFYQTHYNCTRYNCNILSRMRFMMRILDRLDVNRFRPFKAISKKLAPRPELQCLEIESFRALVHGNFGLRFDRKAKWARIPPSNSGRIRIGSLIARRYRLS